MALTIEAVSEFLEMADRVNRVVDSTADQEDIYDFIRSDYDAVSESTGIKVKWGWYDYYGGDYGISTMPVICETKSIKKPTR